MLLIENSIFSIVSDIVGHAYEGFGLNVYGRIYDNDGFYQQLQPSI